jgi:rRNA maturation endonuclease Nob1
MDIAIGIVIIVLSAAFVAQPFLTSEGATEVVGSVSRGQLERQKLDAYAAIKEAEFDHRMGKLSDGDLKMLRDKYAAQAVEAMAALDVAQKEQPRQLAHARRPARIAFCPMCGRAVPPRANFCPACGRALQEAVA